MSELLTPAAKVDVIRGYAERWARPVWVETGIWEGWGSMMRLLDQAPELWPELYIVCDWSLDNCEAVSEWAGADRPVEVLYGDSALTLPDRLATLEKPGLFWLDAHHHDAATGEASCPLWDELVAVAWHDEDNVVLIDDLRMIEQGWEGFPPLGRVRELARARWDVLAEADILRLTPKGATR